MTRETESRAGTSMGNGRRSRAWRLGQAQEELGGRWGEGLCARRAPGCLGPDVCRACTPQVKGPGSTIPTPGWGLPRPHLHLMRGAYHLRPSRSNNQVRKPVCSWRCRWKDPHIAVHKLEAASLCPQCSLNNSPGPRAGAQR